MHVRKCANSFAALTRLKLGKRVEQIFLFHRFLNLMSFSSDLVLSARVNGVDFGFILVPYNAKFQDLPGASPSGPHQESRWGAYSTLRPPAT